MKKYIVVAFAPVIALLIILGIVEYILQMPRPTPLYGKGQQVETVADNTKGQIIQVFCIPNEAVCHYIVQIYISGQFKDIRLEEHEIYEGIK